MSRTPHTPYEVLQISHPELKAAIDAEVARRLASDAHEIPDPDGATDLPEMGLADLIAWGGKSVKPVTVMENGIHTDDVINRDASVVGLPAGFRKNTSFNLAAIGDLFHVHDITINETFFQNVAPVLFAPDTFAFATLESPETTKPLVPEILSDSGPPLECTNNKGLEERIQYKGRYFNGMNFAHNHAMDMGIEGIETTLKSFKQRDILPIGVNHAPEEYGKGKIVTVEGIKVGFVSATFGLNGHVLPPGEEYRINVAKLLSKYEAPDLSLVKKQIDHCKEEKCDFIVYINHSGFEFEMKPRLREVNSMHALAEYGADLILSSHPHSIQPVDYRRTERDPDRIVPIVYSLGSANWGFTAEHIALSLLTNFTITKGEIAGKQVTYIEKADIIPIFQSIDNETGTATLELLSDHIGGSERHSKEYIDKMVGYTKHILKPSV